MRPWARNNKGGGERTLAFPDIRVIKQIDRPTLTLVRARDGKEIYAYTVYSM
jgi:hypothetical protein